jgi:hypothetical protein
VLGIVHLLARVGALDESEGHEVVEAVRGDGSGRTLAMPIVTISSQRAADLRDLEVG